MSYPAITMILDERGIDLDTAPESELRGALWEAFQQNLPDGVAWLRSLTAEMIESGEVVTRHEDPDSPLGRQIARILGTDVARSIAEEQFGREFGVPALAFGMYNCCGGRVAPSRDALRMSAREQIMCQNGMLATANC